MGRSMKTNGLSVYRDATFQGRAGVARRDITPPVGIYNRNWGAATTDVAEGIHRPLTATALALANQAGGLPVLLCSLDLGWWRAQEDEWALRRAVLDALSLDPARVVIHLIHTHAGPSICREDVDKPGGHFIAPYLDALREAVVGAARDAVEMAQHTPAWLDWAYGRCNLARNRDLIDPQWPERVVCGFNPDGDADDTVLVGRVAGADGQVLATLVNYACHPTTLAWQNHLISPDYVGAMREVVERHTNGAPCLFLLGAAGELGPAEQYTGDTAVADKNGRVLGYAAVSTLEGMLPPGQQLAYQGVIESGAPLATWQRAPISDGAGEAMQLSAVCAEVELALKPLQTEQEIRAEMDTCRDPVMLERLRRRLRVRRTVGGGPDAHMPLWCWRMGETVLVAQPNEAHQAFQMQLRQRLAPHPVVVINLANGGCGYLPADADFTHDRYQMWQSPFERGSLERLIESSAAELRRLVD